MTEVSVEFKIQGFTAVRSYPRFNGKKLAHLPRKEDLRKSPETQVPGTRWGANPNLPIPKIFKIFKIWPKQQTRSLQDFRVPLGFLANLPAPDRRGFLVAFILQYS